MTMNVLAYDILFCLVLWTILIIILLRICQHLYVLKYHITCTSLILKLHYNIITTELDQNVTKMKRK
jgi:hypothetical protein